jgi:hypothetical protein
VQPVQPTPPHCPYKAAEQPDVGPAPALVVVFDVEVDKVVLVVVAPPPEPPLPADDVGLLPTAQADSHAMQAPPADFVEPSEYTIRFQVSRVPYNRMS